MEEERTKIIHCSKCGKEIKFDKHDYKGGTITKKDIMEKLKEHYLKVHGYWKTGYYANRDN